MAKPMVCKNLGMKPGTRIKLVGVLSSYVKKFSIEMGKDEKNLALYFSPRFNLFSERNMIVCNSMDNGHWGIEKKEPYFPFTHGASVEFYIHFKGKFCTVTLQDGFLLGFPNHNETTMIDYLAVYGDIRITSLDFQ